MKTAKTPSLAERIRRDGYRVAVEIQFGSRNYRIYVPELEDYYGSFTGLLLAMQRFHGKDRVSYHLDYLSGRPVIRILEKYSNAEKLAD